MGERILVLGGTGTLGRPVARRLKADGFNVRLLARDPEKAKRLLGEGFEVVHGDVTDADSLAKGMADCDGVHISVGGPVDQLSAENVAALAPQAGVRRITYISGSTVAEHNGWFPVIQQKLMAEKAIRECGVSHTIFCATWPFESLALFVRDGRASMIGKQPTPYHWFAADDLARMVSTAYQRDEASNKRFYVHGPQAITVREALERYCRALHPEITSVSAAPPWLVRLLGVVTRNEMLVYAADLMGYFDKAGELGDGAEADELLGGPTTTLDEWIDGVQA